MTTELSEESIALNRDDFLAQLDACLVDDNLEAVRVRIADLRAHVAVWEPGGMGVFDPGINALSILTEILPFPVHLTGAVLEVPENRATPIAARLEFTKAVTADFDWRQEGPQTWDIDIDTAEGPVALRMGGNRLEVDGRPVEGRDDIMGEYPALYARMAALVAAGQSDVDLAPMVHVADAMSLGRRVATAAFHF